MTQQFPNSYARPDTTLSAPYTMGDGVLHITATPPGVAAVGAEFQVKAGNTLYLVTAVSGLDWAVTPAVEGTTDANHIVGTAVYLELTRAAVESIRALDSITETDQTANGYPNSVPKASTTFPPAAHHTAHEPSGSDPMAVDAAAGTGSLRTLGTGATQAAAGNDSRLSNARTPTAHAASHKNGGSDEVATATPGANAIPKAGGAGTLALGWLAQVLGLVDLTDIDFSTPAVSGQALVWNGTKWVPGTVAASGGEVALDDSDPGVPVTDDTGDWLYA